MGFFSFKTQDTNRSISNRYSKRSPFVVYMHDNGGTTYVEHDYDGYGEFGGVDYFDLMALMNGMKSRLEAIESYCNNQDDVLYPNLTESSDWQWRNERPERCKVQGYFYDSTN